MTKTLRIHRLAEDELTAAASWYEAKRAGLGDSLLDLIDSIVDRICSGSFPGSPAPGVAIEKGTRRVLLQRFPYSIVFYERKNEVVIVAFAHSSRRPGYWRSRKV
ncbi:MAG TPA: type II toxin-antitoxin system RelE/ParE family toxin [Pyrinomonadaceae bacterium]|nr:type II toxin-antitoxin system RelE/ParE family toxin [Pyrinomonadaceae bacterium]